MRTVKVLLPRMMVPRPNSALLSLPLRPVASDRPFLDVPAADDRLFSWMDLWVRGTREEVVRINLENGFRTIYDVYESLWIAMQSGTVDRAYATKLFERYLPYTSLGEIGRHMWRSIRQGYAPEFVKFVDDFQNDTPAPASDEEMIAWMKTIRKYRPEIFFDETFDSSK